MFERAFGPIVKDTAAGLDLVTASADGSSEQVILHFRSLEAQGKEPHDAQWSPDGTRIAVNILNIKAKPRNGSAIYVLDADGSDLRRITPLRLNAGSPDWSPDGKRIVFNSSYEGQSAVEIYTVRPDGSGLKRVRKEPKKSFSFEPVWSPNGKRIAFAHATTTTPPHIWTMKKNGTRLRQVTHGRRPTAGPTGGRSDTRVEAACVHRYAPLSPTVRTFPVSTVALNAEELGTVLKQLTSRLGGRVVGPQDPEWNDARRAWNLAVDQHPAAVAIPESVEDVVAVVEVAREQGLRVAPQGTGHSAAPRGPLLRSVLVNMSGMNAVEIDPRSPSRAATGGRAVAARHGPGRRAWAGGIVGLGARRVRDRLRARWRRELDGPPPRAGRQQHPGRRGCYCRRPAAPRRRR